MTVLLLFDVYTELVIDVFYTFNSTVIDWTFFDNQTCAALILKPLTCCRVTKVNCNEYNFHITRFYRNYNVITINLYL